MKERTVALDKMLRAEFPEVGIIGSVHDDTLIEGPAEVVEDNEFTRRVVACLEATDVLDLRVPLRCSAGVSRESWFAASKASIPVPFDRRLYGPARAGESSPDTGPAGGPIVASPPIAAGAGDRPAPTG